MCGAAEFAYVVYYTILPPRKTFLWKTFSINEILYNYGLDFGLYSAMYRIYQIKYIFCAQSVALVVGV